MPLPRYTMCSMVIAIDSRLRRHVQTNLAVALSAHYYSAPDSVLDAI